LKRLLALSSTILALLGLVAANLVATAAPASQGATSLRLYAGDGSGTVSMNDFRMPLVRVAQGATVTWIGGTDEPHTVTFIPPGMPRPELVVPQPEDPTGRPPMFNPDVFFPRPATGPWDGTTYVNSAFIEKGQEFPVTFGRQGRFEYVCMLHVPMVGVVEVVAPGSAGLTTQDEVNAYNVTRTSTVGAPQLEQILATRGALQTSPGPAGSTAYVARAGTEARYSQLDVYQFFPDQLTIQQGDMVVWFNDNPTIPHTVTFPAAGQDPPDFIVPTLPDGTVVTGPPPEPPAGGPPPDPSQLPRLVVGPAAVPTRPSATYDGIGLYNSGFIGDLSPTGQASWGLTFDTPGTFKYLCVIHVGMEGTIVVQPR
jgi:plastocyanin